MNTSSSTRKKSKIAKIYEIDLEDPSGAEVTVQISGKGNVALVDTGASCSCMSEESYNLHGSPLLKTLCNINVKSASGNSLQPMGMTNCNVSLGGREYSQPFIICKKLTRNVILGRDFLRNHRLHVGWSKEGRFQVHSGKEVVVGAITVEENPIVTMKRNITVPPKTLVVAEMQVTIPDMENSTY
ncbi:MAG: retroviral-like aspartic protease family protein, partial [Proteobacteria bacterium]|nr:retroviral-like aspartic protease family protein [Pseudomonadota bacterium]